ncbi:PH domain-containing protein [Parasphingopyxis algicola]|uniref:photosynthetic complex putative assembly protein PuhB n=1 Tax=Parasphingopyxis algicola TaxID=2026624 RepID=UPI0015A11B96|nr:photosynthetic complex putative assembly protein PuhB [Parasphingopyxis algicola]QLC24771.1 PH domain-containing protein [Parasphingopyxis algicola]
MSEYDHEPIRGLPGYLPEGEEIIWQGAPDWLVFARTAFRTRLVGVYFVFLAALGIASGSVGGAVATAVAGLFAIGLLMLLAWLVARTTVYTITNRRVVLRIGVALNKCINLPLQLIESADLSQRGGGHGDIALTLKGPHRLGYAMLWPHARPWKFADARPMLRALPDVEAVAAKLARASAAVVEIERPAEERSDAAVPAGVQEIAA